MKANYAAWHIPSVEFSSLSPHDKLHHLLRYAVLAPSAHNTQPWSFELAPTKSTIHVFIDSTRLLGQSDPSLRQSYLSIGAAIENIRAAALAYGAHPTISYVLDEYHVADIVIEWSQTSIPNDALLKAMRERITNRSNFRHEELSANELSLTDIKSDTVSIKIIPSRSLREKIGALVASADLRLMNKAFKRELSGWVHNKWTKQHTGMPASVQGLPAPATLIAKRVVRHAPIEKGQAKKDAKHLADGPLIVVFLGSNDGKKVWLETGQLFERVWLQATEQGFDVAPLTSAIESAPERKDLQNLLHTSNDPLAIMRVGHATRSMPRSPRLTASQVTKK